MMGFPKRMLIVVSIIVLIVNLVMFARLYWFQSLSSGLFLFITFIEILVIAIQFAYWVSKYKLKW